VTVSSSRHAWLTGPRTLEESPAEVLRFIRMLRYRRHWTKPVSVRAAAFDVMLNATSRSAVAGAPVRIL
jgi:hypothetical protein